MSIDFESVFREMLDAATGVLADESADIKLSLKQVLDDEKETLKMIADLRLNHEISKEQMIEELNDEKLVLAAGMAMVQAQSKAALQKAANAAINVLKNSVSAAIRGGI